MGHHVGRREQKPKSSTTCGLSNLSRRAWWVSAPVTRPGVADLDARNAKLSARIISSTLEIRSIQGKFKPL